MALCSACGHETPDPQARFCASCGQPLGSAAASEVTSMLSLGGPADEPSSPDGDVAPGHGLEAGVLDRLAAGTALLVVKRGPSSGARFLLDADVTTAGRHPESDIFLDDITVSRRHAEFRRDAEGFRVVDVGSLNGTYVNRARVDDVRLINADEVQVGKYRLVFLSATAEEDSE
ncbi:MAG: FHA domain-containing protein [Actinomycetes bacterium]